MTREEQINQAAWKYDAENRSPGSEDYKAEGFIAGARWADSHAQWHLIDYTDNSSYVNSTPANEVPVIVAFRYHDHDTVYIEIATFSLEGTGKVYNGPGIVLAWAELLQPPKFD